MMSAINAVYEVLKDYEIPNMFNDQLFKTVLDLVKNTCFNIIDNHGVDPVIDLSDTSSEYVESEKFYSEDYRQLINKYFLNIKIFNYAFNYLSDLKI